MYEGVSRKGVQGGNIFGKKYKLSEWGKMGKKRLFEGGKIDKKNCPRGVKLEKLSGGPKWQKNGLDENVRVTKQFVLSNHVAAVIVTFHGDTPCQHFNNFPA